MYSNSRELMADVFHRDFTLMYFTMFLYEDDDDDVSTTCQGRIQDFSSGGGEREADSLGLQNR